MNWKVTTAWVLALCCALAASAEVYFTWPAFVARPWTDVNNALIAAAAVAAVVLLAKGYFNVKVDAKPAKSNCPVCALQIDELKVLVHDAIRQIEGSMQKVEIESEKLRGLYRIREIAAFGGKAHVGNHGELDDLFHVVSASQEAR